MPSSEKLSQHLAETLTTLELTGGSNSVRDQIIHYLKKNQTVEAALNDTLSAVGQIPEDVTSCVKRTIAEKIISADAEARDHVLDSDNTGLMRLMKRLFASSNTRCEIVTTNYDCLAEYQIGMCGYTAFDGFSLGTIGIRLNAFTRENYLPKNSRVINVHKVHGSINWWKDKAGKILKIPPSESRLPEIVPPSDDKHKITQSVPYRSVIAAVDRAFDSAHAALCLGYGFNDTHIQEPLKQRWINDNLVMVIVTKKLTSAAREFLEEHKGRQRFVCLTEGGGENKTQIEFSNGNDQSPQKIEIDGSYWKLEHLMEVLNG